MPRSDLARLPQFEPDHTFRLNETQHESVLPFPESRARQIRDVLSAAMTDHVRKARFQGKSTSLERFLGNAMLAIATYESRSLRRRLYDRGRASKLVKEVSVALLAFQQTLKRTVEWKQLDRYLEMLFVADRKQKKRQHDEREGKRSVAKLSIRALKREMKLADLYRAQFRARSPEELLNRLKFLEPLLTLALERLELQPGDAQRDEIAREFASAMMFAWMSATGAVPTISKSKPLPFQRLLARVNRDILKPEIRHRTDFRYPAVFAVDRARKTRQGREPRP
jgi:hypothetical protein